MRDTISNAVAELVETIAPGGTPAVAGLVRVYDHEPAPGQIAKPTSATVAWAATDPNFWTLLLRVYQTTDVDARVAARNLEAVSQALDVLLEPYWGPAEWSAENDRELGALIATCRIEVGREDGKLRTGGGL
jgi:hypothetical protein